MKREAIAALALLAGGCIARSPAEPPIRILHLARDVPVRIASAPPGLRVYAVAGGGAGALLGRTPLVVDRIPLEKEIWKHSAASPPPRSGSPLLVRAETDSSATRRSEGRPLVWSVLVEVEPGRPPRRFDFSLSPDQLDRAFADRGVEFLVPAGDNGRGEP